MAGLTQIYINDLENFLDRIYRINKILIFHFQFPDETENTQSPAANKKGNYNLLLGLIMLRNTEIYLFE